MNPMLEAAMEYVSKGWRVFPVSGKIPVTKRGVLDASTDLPTIRSWWANTPYGIALATGGGLVVLDVDPKNDGPDSLAELETKYGKLPSTLTVLTPSGGQHFYFNSSNPIRNSAGKLGAGIDMRGDGGYVVIPPSPGYTWDLGYDGPLAELPSWVLGLLIQPIRSGVSVPPGAPVKFGNGQRNAELAAMAGALRRRGAGTETLLAALEEANRTQCEPPLDQREVEQIARSISRYDPNSPRRGEGRYLGGTSVQREGPNGSGLPQDGAFRRPRKPRSVRDGAWYLGRGR